MELILGQGQSSDTAIIGLLVGLLAFIVWVAILRWIFRVNTIVKTQEAILEELKRVARTVAGTAEKS